MYCLHKIQQHQAFKDNKDAQLTGEKERKGKGTEFLSRRIFPIHYRLPIISPYYTLSWQTGHFTVCAQTSASLVPCI